MKKILILFLVILLINICTACNKEEEEKFPDFSVNSQNGSEEKTHTEKSSAETIKKSIYDPGIFVIEAAGTWQQEFAEGYYADYECELYLDKFDANDNRSASGFYTGVFWMKTKLNIDEYLKDFLKNVHVEMDFATGGEGICDNLTMHLLDGYQRDSFKDFSIPGGNEPHKDALAGEGSFIAVGKDAYLNIYAQGAGRESLQHNDSSVSGEEISYVIQIEPDLSKTSDELKVTIHLSNGEGMNATIEGTWKRLPGYPEDRIKYANEGKQGEFLDKHLQ